MNGDFFKEFSKLFDFIFTFERYCKSKILTSIFGSTVSNIEFDLFTIPTRLAGLGLCDLVKKATDTFQQSRMASDLILKSRKDCLPFSVADHNQHFHRTSNEGRSKQHQLGNLMKVEFEL